MGLAWFNYRDIDMELFLGMSVGENGMCMDEILFVIPRYLLIECVKCNIIATWIGWDRRNIAFTDFKIPLLPLSKRNPP